jgi:hypothetical protein
MRGGEAWARAVARAETAAEATEAAADHRLDPREFFALGARHAHAHEANIEGDHLYEQQPPEPVTVGLLRRRTGVPWGDADDTLGAHTALALAVDTRDDQPCDAIGTLMPQLQQLHLVSVSTLCSVRDLGTSLRRLRVLKASRCGLRELDGIAALPSLEELYLSFNDVWELSPLALHESLQVLDLEANAIDAASQVALLATVPTLQHLTLDGNPLVRRCRSRNEYRGVVCAHLRRLQTLDDEPVTAADQRPPGHAPHAAYLYRSNALDTSGSGASPPASPGLSRIVGLDRATAFNRLLVGDAESQLVADAIKRAHRAVASADAPPDDGSGGFGKGSSSHGQQAAADGEGKSGGERSLGNVAALDRSAERSAEWAFGSVLTHGGNGHAMAGNVSRGLRHRQGTRGDVPFGSEADERPRPALRTAAAGPGGHCGAVGGAPARHASLRDAAVEALKARALVCRPSSGASSPASSEPGPHCDESPASSRPSSTGDLPWPPDQREAARAGLRLQRLPTAGGANACADAWLVALLQRRPKEVPELRTRSAFQRFFHGMAHDRLAELLRAAYAHLDPATAAEKVDKRLRLFAVDAE